MPKFRLNRKAFIAPYIYDEGDIIEYDGPLGLAFEPVDEEGAAALDAFFKEKPHAKESFVDRLRATGGEPGEARATLVEKAAPDSSLTGNVAQAGKAQPGLSDGGKLTADVNRDGKVDKNDLKPTDTKK